MYSKGGYQSSSSGRAAVLVPGQTIRAEVHFVEEEGPRVLIQGAHPASAWLDYLHLPLGYLARIMFTMPHDEYYGCQYFLESLQEAYQPVHLESLALELGVGLSLRHPEWHGREQTYRVRQRHARPVGHFYMVEAAIPAEYPGARLAQSFAHLTLEVLRRLSGVQTDLLLHGLRRMARAYLSGEVNPYDWKSLVGYPQAVFEDLLNGTARYSRGEA